MVDSLTTKAVWLCIICLMFLIANKLLGDSWCKENFMGSCRGVYYSSRYETYDFFSEYYKCGEKKAVVEREEKCKEENQRQHELARLQEEKEQQRWNNLTEEERNDEILRGLKGADAFCQLKNSSGWVSKGNGYISCKDDKTYEKINGYYIHKETKFCELNNQSFVETFDIETSKILVCSNDTFEFKKPEEVVVEKRVSSSSGGWLFPFMYGFIIGGSGG